MIRRYDRFLYVILNIPTVYKIVQRDLPLISYTTEMLFSNQYSILNTELLLNGIYCRIATFKGSEYKTYSLPIC